MSFPGIEGKVAIVTGAGGGIGEGYAKALAAEGARVAIAEIVKQNGERVAREIRSAGGTAAFVEVDVGSEIAIDQTVSVDRGDVEHEFQLARVGDRAIGDPIRARLVPCGVARKHAPRGFPRPEYVR